MKKSRRSWPVPLGRSALEYSEPAKRSPRSCARNWGRRKTGDGEMKQQLSDLMAGELDRGRSDAAWKSLSADAELRDCWRTYHLIGDCMRGEVVTDSVVRFTPADKI